MAIFEVKSWQLQPQENEVVLLSLQLNAQNSEEFAIHGQYTLQCDVNETLETIQLALFQTPSDNSLQFLVYENQISAIQNQTHLTHTLIYTAPETPLVIDTNQNQLFIGIDSKTLPAGAPVFALAKHTQNQKNSDLSNAYLALLNSEKGFGFRIKPARFMVELDAPEAIGACSLLEDWQIPNRLAVTQGLVGAMEGSISQLISSWTNAYFSNNHQNSNPWQVWVFYGNKKGQQLLTFDRLQSLEDFKKLVANIKSL